MYLARSSPTVLTWFMDASARGLQRPHSGTPRPPGASTPSGPLKRPAIRADSVPLDVQSALEGGSPEFPAGGINNHDVSEAAPLQIPRSLHRLLIRPASEGHGPARRIDTLHDKHNMLSAFLRRYG